MKKITFLCFLLITSFGFSQNTTTGTVDLTTDFTVRFDITLSSVTVTMEGPASVGFAVALSNTSYTPGGTMGQFSGDDVIFYTSGSITDRSMPASNGSPSIDAIPNNWTISANTVSGSTRTVVATRDRNTGDANDFVFAAPPNLEPVTIVWAIGGNASFSFHSQRGATVANTVLSNKDFQLNPVTFTISPNPSYRDLNVGINYNASKFYSLEVYDILGKQIHRGQLTKDNNAIDASGWRRGVYLVKLSSDDATQTKRFIKQ